MLNFIKREIKRETGAPAFPKFWGQKSIRGVRKLRTDTRNFIERDIKWETERYSGLYGNMAASSQ
jgi:hypothetical protein